MPGSSSWMPYAPQGVKGIDDDDDDDDDDRAVFYRDVTWIELCWACIR